jgi:hypothetical protein
MNGSAARGVVALAITGACLALSGCSSGVDAQRVDAITGADALWSGGGDFCARTPKALLCWSTGEHQLVETAPAPIEGLTGVTDVAMAVGHACALADGGVWCFAIRGKPAVTKKELESPTAVAAFGGYQAHFCALDAAGVACWRRDHPNLVRVPAFGKPRALLPSVDGDSLCSVDEGSLRCFDVDPGKGQLRATFVVGGLRDPKAVFTQPGGSGIAVLDGTTVRYADVQRIELKGNPFAASNPLDVAVEVKPFTTTSVAPGAVEGLGTVTHLAHRSIWPLALDERGVSTLDRRLGRIDAERWPIEGVPDGLWPGGRNEFFTRQGGALHQRGWDSGKRVDRAVRGLARPEKVAPGLYWTCVLDAAGAIGCVKNQRI